TGRSNGVRVTLLPTEESGCRAAVGALGARGAVQRNRIRRRLRAAAAVALGDLRGCDVVVQARAEDREASFVQLTAAVTAAVAQAMARPRA
ncbi:MAG: ribonuclease P protein component, partial [Candidatus Dormibacteria bacterium]